MNLICDVKPLHRCTQGSRQHHARRHPEPSPAPLTPTNTHGARHCITFSLTMILHLRFWTSRALPSVRLQRRFPLHRAHTHFPSPFHARCAGGREESAANSTTHTRMKAVSVGRSLDPCLAVLRLFVARAYSEPPSPISIQHDGLDCTWLLFFIHHAI